MQLHNEVKSFLRLCLYFDAIIIWGRLKTTWTRLGGCIGGKKPFCPFRVGQAVKKGEKISKQLLNGPFKLYTSSIGIGFFLQSNTLVSGLSVCTNANSAFVCTPANISIYFQIKHRKVASSRLVYYSILNSFGQRSLYISIIFPLHKQSENS